MAHGDAETVVAVPAGERALIAWGFPIAGMALGWLLKAAAGWIAGLSWAPLQGPFKLIAQIPEPWATVGALAVGLVGGLVLALIAHGERLDVTVTPGHVRLVGDEYDETFARDDITAVFVDRNQLVLLGSDTGELVRRPSELDVAALRAAFTRHGYPWRDGDPHADQYRRWVPGAEGLPPAANALLTAREKNPDDAEELRAELARLGVIVRDEKRKQYWRLAE
jgi:hypothetical protein